MRRFKEVKRKEVIYDTREWAEVERRAASVSMQTSEFIRRMSIDGKINYLEMKNLAPLLNGMKIISNNINQIAKKANEINSVYAEDLEKIRKENAELCRLLSLYLSAVPLLAA